MPVKKRGLGRGLDALLGGAKLSLKSADFSKPDRDVAEKRSSKISPSIPGTSKSQPGDGDLRNIPIEYIQPGKYQPRLDMRLETLEDLANSIKSQGVMQPILVRPVGADRYEIIAGERRWRAAQIAGLDKIPTLIRDVADGAAIVIALIENIQREDLNPIEEAAALKRLQGEFGLTQQEVADSVGKSRAAVANIMRLMSLNSDVRKYLEHGEMEQGHARALLSLSDEKQTTAAQMVIRKGLSVRQTESLVRRMLSGRGGNKQAGSVDPDIRQLQDSLSEKLGTQVLVQHTAKGKGRLILKYNSLDQLDGILAHIK